MNTLKKLFFDDISPFKDLMNEKEIKNYQLYKYIYAFIGLVLFGVLVEFEFGLGYMFYLSMVLGLLLGYKFPYILLKLRYKQKMNEIIDTIPIWVNSIYSLIGENNIYNAIVLSYDSCPKAIKSDLKEFIDKINVDNDDKYAYISFLQKYHIEGFRDIMMKIYEFRNLSKDKLKHEISALNEILGKFEGMKRVKRLKNELSVVDNSTLIMLTIPCLYLFFISILLSDVMM